MSNSHGLSRSRVYSIWHSMRSRCEFKAHKSWQSYGGSGITVCERWKTFENFFADMGHPPPGMQLDRFPNQSGNYEPGNVRWATTVEQARNKKTNVYATAFGERKLLLELLADPRCIVTHRIVELRMSKGWPAELALTTPRERISAASLGVSARDEIRSSVDTHSILAERYGVSRSTIKRIRAGSLVCESVSLL